MPRNRAVALGRPRRRPAPPASTQPRTGRGDDAGLDAPSSVITRGGATIGAEGARRLLPLAEAVRLVLGEAHPLGGERVPLDDALGRVAAGPVRSADEVPPFDNSAMDGFAVRSADTAGAGASGVELRVVDESRAGAPASRELGAGEAARISTGAMLPRGADAVVRLEDAEDRGEAVVVGVAVEPGHDVRRAGEDVRAGDVVIGAGALLGPAELGVLASVGLAEVECARRPLATVLATGDELTPPGEPLGPGDIRDANAHSVPAQALAAGCEAIEVASVPDERAATVEAIRSGLGADLLIVCGGVSVGAHDHVKAALAELGVEERFWGIALRPGRPTWFGVAVRGQERTLVFGLPGNPVSAMVTFHLLVRPAVAAMLGSADRGASPVRAVLDERYAKRPGRLHAVRCTLDLRDDGWHARPTGAQGSHVLTSMLGAQGLAMVEAERGDVEAGEPVEVVPFSPWPAPAAPPG